MYLSVDCVIVNRRVYANHNVMGVGIGSRGRGVYFFKNWRWRMKRARGKNSMMKTILKMLVVLSLLVMPAVAGAVQTQVDFLVFNSGGSVTYTPTSASTGTLTGANIEISKVIGYYTPANPSVAYWTLVHDPGTVTLSFTAPATVIYSGGGIANYSAFGGTVAIKYSGGGDLLNGTVLNGVMTNMNINFQQGTFGAKFHCDALSAAIQGFYGVGDLPLGSISLSGVPNAGLTSFTPNTGSVSVVPIPGAVWLLGTGLVGLVGVRRRFLS
jgi:hypothetical protein